jgi:hypothetical protein
VPVTFNVTEASITLELAGIEERSHLSTEEVSLPLPRGWSPFANKKLEVPVFVVGEFSINLVSAVLVRDVVVAAVFTVQARLAGVESVLVEASVALTLNVWDPSERLV